MYVSGVVRQTLVRGFVAWLENLMLSGLCKARRTRKVVSKLKSRARNPYLSSSLHRTNDEMCTPILEWHSGICAHIPWDISKLSENGLFYAILHFIGYQGMAFPRTLEPPKTGKIQRREHRSSTISWWPNRVLSLFSKSGWIWGASSISRTKALTMQYLGLVKRWNCVDAHETIIIKACSVTYTHFFVSKWTQLWPPRIRFLPKSTDDNCRFRAGLRTWRNV